MVTENILFSACLNNDSLPLLVYSDKIVKNSIATKHFVYGSKHVNPHTDRIGVKLGI